MSSYTHCPCRDCFEIAMDGDLCHECEEAGCDADGHSDCEAAEYEDACPDCGAAGGDGGKCPYAKD